MFNYQNAMQFIQTMKNPQQFLQNMGIPKEHMNNPQDVEKYLLDNGRITQEQIDQAKNLYSQLFHR